MSRLSYFHCVKVVIAFATVLLVASCSKDGVETFGFDEDISQHFGDMNYGAFVIDGLPASGRAEVSVVTGDGHFEHEDGTSLQYKWAFLVRDDGGLAAGYIGDAQREATSVVFLTEDETRDEIRRCSETHEDVSDLFACIDQVIDRVIADCQSSMSVEECHKHCWYNPSLCRGM